MSNRSPHADVNRSAVLAHLGAHGPASRADLSRALGVSPAHMTQLTRELLADGLVVELEQAPSQGGRPARMLGVAAAAGSAVGVKVVADHVAFVEVGIDGTVVRSAAREFDASATTALADLTELLSDFIADARSPRLLGVGVGIPGSVDNQASGVVDSVQLGWTQLPVGATLRRALGHPVLVENNVNALAMAERLYGIGREHDDFLVVTIGTGVGSGIVLGGSVFRGAAGGAGEIGHIPVAEDGPQCSCGNHGCLEALISETALVQTARARGVIDAGDGIDALRAAADAGVAGAFAVFAEAGHRLGRALAGLIHIIDPELVVVMGEGTSAWPHWSAGFEPALRSALIPSRRGIAVAVETWQDESWAQGAAALVLATPFDADGIAGAEGELVRERLVSGSGGGR
ncbi:ROK family transcriptional regulator [Gryllotalpicola koreensis]|uniref:ROK family protein n=1 Tax=Gryllotalpicola koreensis TaxID=993086 RepID=A0ABP7ZS31_9MICO